MGWDISGAPAGTLTGTTLASNVTASSLTSVGVLAAPHMTAPVVDSGGLTLNGSVNAYSGDELTFGSTAASPDYGITTKGTGSPRMRFDHRATTNTGTWLWANGTGAGSIQATLSAVGLFTAAGGLVATTGGLLVSAGGAKVVGLGAFASGDKYVIAAADGTFHISGLGPAS